MNNVFTTKLLQNLNNKKGNKGFTLIELLVVVIIIGVLAAIALPNLLGQVGKARESEAKTALGAVNRSQQAYHLESKNFYDSATWSNVETALGVVTGKEYYSYASITPTAAGDLATTHRMNAVAINPNKDGARDFGAGLNFNNGAYKTTLCVATNKSTATDGRTAAVAGTGAETMVADTSAGTCTTGTAIK